MPSVTSHNLVATTILFSLLAFEAHAVSSIEANSPSSTVECERYRHTGFWDVDIDNFPDLPPECGPPFSFNADRDPNHLPIQLVIIFASYLALTIFVGTSILTIRFRRKTRLYPKAIELQLVEKQPFDLTSPKSPNSILSWMRNPLKKKGPGQGDPRSPGIDSIASFDFNVIEHDRAKREAELDRLYAAVLAHDETRKSQLSQLTELNPDKASQPPLPRVPSNASMTRTSKALTENGLPTRVSMASTINSRAADRRLARVVQSDIPKSPMSQGAPRTYSQDQPEGHGMVPMSPGLPSAGLVSAGLVSPGYNYPMSPIGQVQLPNDMYPASPPAGERRMRLPNQPFSPALSMMQHGVMSPATTIFSPGLMSARTPLPQDMYPQSPVREEFDVNVLPTPTFPPNMGLPDRPNSSSSRGKPRRNTPSIRVNTNLQTDTDDDRAPLSASFQTSPPDDSAASSPEEYFKRPATAGNAATGRARRPPTLNLNVNNKSTTSLQSNAGLPSSPAPPNTQYGSKANTPISKPLPLRVAFDSSADVNPVSPGIVKTTILQPRRDAFSRGPRTARTPGTGQIPPTPYSAYMPFTPVTPITPHLVTRKERKQKRKQEGRTLMDDSDLVREASDEEENWNKA